MQHVIDFTQANLTYLPEVGGKNASLGEMITKLASLGIKVPGGFATTATSYKNFLVENNLENKIYPLLDSIDINNIDELKNAGKQIRGLITAANFSNEFIEAVSIAYQQLNLSSSQSVAVRSSATAEDLPDASFAGQQETYLNISGMENVLAAIKNVFASLFTERSIAYRVHNGFAHHQVAISAGVQQMVRSDIASSGVMFTVDTETGFDQVVFITAAYGLGETIVQGQVDPDEYYIHKPTLELGKQSIVSRALGSKKIKMVYSDLDTMHNPVKTVEVEKEKREQFCLNNNEILSLATQAMIIEKHYGKPMDIEWAKDGESGELYIIQARPETVTTQKSHQYIEQYHLGQTPKALITGRSVGHAVASGKARIINNVSQMSVLNPGEILVADITDPDWEPVMKRAAAIVTNRGGRTCHAAIIARELGIPAVVGCGNAMDIIKDGMEITVSCAEGETGYIYPEKVPVDIEKIEVGTLPKLPIKLYMNLANPEQAFSYQSLPNDGVGLARLEFIISSMIAIHPAAILGFAEMPEDIQNKILQKTAAYSSPKEFYIERLAEGIATIAAAFYPKPVIVRFSDFKSNEYASLLGGKLFEPEEENPMLGYRGGSRYISGDFKNCFSLECEAIKRVRNNKGLTNTHVMFPFVRTINEAKELTAIAKNNDLKRSDDAKNKLNIYMMCEIPANALLAEDFLKYFDGFSIGSNDLTQLTLGLDRDSDLVAHLFDERDPAVKKLLSQAIKACNKMNKYVGICGQAPSDYPELAQWLVNEGIDSLSLNPDAVIKTWLSLAKAGIKPA